MGLHGWGFYVFKVGNGGYDDEVIPNNCMICTISPL